MRIAKGMPNVSEEYMECNHGSEYQIKCIHKDGTEEVSEWMKSEVQLAQAIAELPRGPGKTHWLRKRNVLCPDCFDTEMQVILEHPISDTSSSRHRPHDSRYLNAVGSRNRYGLLDLKQS